MPLMDAMHDIKHARGTDPLSARRPPRPPETPKSQQLPCTCPEICQLDHDN